MGSDGMGWQGLRVMAWDGMVLHRMAWDLGVLVVSTNHSHALSEIFFLLQLNALCTGLLWMTFN